ncbi:MULTISPECIES: aminotransferase class V-fold PLP-dependent enzyme [Rheinheimera]|jgi:selenocysteine lyase/cysteine desulfurase|uniref:aminotransferase class V-fold PLP-dependent enzyme n=1 Tax=Rheinheimera TaxID=67575 RepID=UPI001E614C33|nr:aminotransferase class V-fold PLP-dependent enzyme [Rheinheimera aquimaris]MCD1598914.1 aminotransferase class V-fold PLP-dependent enzyme [Rheinheimera aquimaris]
MYQQFYQRFLQANAGKQHFACHSHHYWPDVTRDAMLEYWDDTARLVDDKWQYIFAEKVPQTQQLIADILQLPQPEQIVFAPNTHELVMRLLSCFDLRQPLHILTTDSEFYSFSRQVKRLAEYDNITIEVIPTEPYATFEQRFIAAAEARSPHFIFCSQVFFNSGVALTDLTGFVQKLAACTDAMIAIDGYHAFMALPTDLSSIAERIFYLAGSYKYAQGGEGCCFMAVPLSSTDRPLYTGWFAEFGTLAAEKSATVLYSEDGYRFAGATMDFSALYRLNAVLRLFKQQGISVGRIHQYVQQLQRVFLAKLTEAQHGKLHTSSLLTNNLDYHGHFLTFRCGNPAEVAELAAMLKRNGIETDYRGDRLRFGFALYHNSEQYDLSCLKQC